MATSQKVLTADSEQRVLNEEEEDEELRDTKDAFYHYFFKKASRDKQLSHTDTVTLKKVQEEVESSEESHGSPQAAQVGTQLAMIGDEVDALYHDEVTKIVQMAGSPEQAVESFGDVVKLVFVDEDGEVKITIGRLGALLAYAYRLCKEYIKLNPKVNLIVTFLGIIVMWLFKFLIKTKFYDWLKSAGGWGKLITDMTTGWGNTLFLIIGVSSLLIWGYNFLKSR